MTRRLVGAAAAVALLIAGAVLLSDPEDRVLDDAERTRLGGTYVTLSDGVTHYRLEGPEDGVPVVLVHGGTIPIFTWDSYVPALVEAGFRVLAYDTFGRGYSDRPDVTYDRALHVRQLRELVDSLAIGESFHLVGLSMGGGTAVTFTTRHPERVRDLVLVAPVVRDYDVPGLFALPVVGDLAARAVGIRVLVRRAADNFGDHPDADRYRERMVEQTTWLGFRRAILSTLRNDALGDFTEEYEAVGRQDRRVLLLWGTADEEITPSMIETAREAIPGVDFRPIDGAGHGVVFQRPDVVLGHLLEFIDDGAGG